MKYKQNKPGKQLSEKQMRKLKGAGWGPKGCIPVGGACGGGGCTDPDPVCCDGAVCSGSNGINPQPGFCTFGGDPWSEVM